MYKKKYFYYNIIKSMLTLVTIKYTHKTRSHFINSFFQSIKEATLHNVSYFFFFTKNTYINAKYIQYKIKTFIFMYLYSSTRDIPIVYFYRINEKFRILRHRLQVCVCVYVFVLVFSLIKRHPSGEIFYLFFVNFLYHDFHDSNDLFAILSLQLVDRFLIYG